LRVEVGRGFEFVAFAAAEEAAEREAGFGAGGGFVGLGGLVLVRCGAGGGREEYGPGLGVSVGRS
jgi:hypothetical protein